MPRDSFKYAISAPTLIAHGVGLMFEGLSVQPWWVALPWDIINYTTAVLIVSFLIQDLCAPQSWLRRFLFNWRAPYVMKSIVLNDEYQPARVVIRAIVEFKRAPKSPAAVVRITPTQGNRAGEVTDVFRVNLGAPVPLEQVKLDIGVLMVPYPHWTPRRSVWGVGTGPENLTAEFPDIVLGVPVKISIEIDGFERSAILLPAEKSAHDKAPDLAVLTEADAEHLVGMR